MGRKPAITKEMLTAEGLQILREFGPLYLTASFVGERLNCSTQPIKYYFKTIEEYRAQVYYEAYLFFKDTIEAWINDGSIGNAAYCYVLFAHKESNVYNYIFTDTKFIDKGVFQLTTTYSVRWFMDKVLEDFSLKAGEEEWCYAHVFYFLHGLSKYISENPAYPFVEEEIKETINQHLAGINLAFNINREN